VHISHDPETKANPSAHYIQVEADEQAKQFAVFHY